MSKDKEIRQSSLELYDKLINTLPKVERKGKAMPYTALNGHMFSFLSKDGIMGLRLSEKDRSSFINQFNSQLMEQHGHMMKEYVIVPNAVLKDTEKLSIYLQKSLDYISELKPKSTKK